MAVPPINTYSFGSFSVAPSSTHPPGPLTTIFTPPSDCFATFPATWSTCVSLTSSTEASCYWSLPASCYPSGAQTYYADSSGLVASEFMTYSSPALPGALHYSPGVMPLGYQAVSTDSARSSATTWACLSGWDQRATGLCTSDASATYEISSKQTVGVFAAVLPIMWITWASSDLSQFTPSGAPALPMSTIASLIKATATGTTFSNPPAHATASPPAKPTSQQPSSTGIVASGHERSKGLTVGAKAGIGVGIVVFVSAILVIGWHLLHRRQRTKKAIPEISK